MDKHRIKLFWLTLLFILGLMFLVLSDLLSDISEYSDMQLLLATLGNGVLIIGLLGATAWLIRSNTKAKKAL